MDRDSTRSTPAADASLPLRELSAPARRALEEAAARRKAASDQVQEVGGRGGLDPVRFGDWEVKGLASDF